MEKAIENLTTCYNSAKKAYQEEDYSICLGQLRLSIEWLCKVLIYEFAGRANAVNLLSNKTKVIYGIQIVPPSNRLESSFLIKAIPYLLDACNGYSFVKGDKTRAKDSVKKQIDVLNGAYSVCSTVAMHASDHQMNLKIQADNNVSTLPAFIDHLHSIGVLKDKPFNTLSSILPVLIGSPAQSSNQAEVNVIKEENERLKEENKKLKEENIDKQKLVNEKDHAINALNAEIVNKDQEVLNANREAFEARREAHEIAEKANAEIREKDAQIAAFEAKRLKEEDNSMPISDAEADAQQERIEQLEEENKQAGTEEQSGAVSSGHGIFVEDKFLDDDQLDLIKQNLSSSMLVAGCAGSGKSVIAMNKARQIIEEGYSVILIAYTKSLHGFMNEGWNDDVLRGHCMYYYQWKEEQHMPSADYIVVDEIQDFTKIEIEEFICAAKKCFFFFGDTAQSIYSFTNRPTLSIEQISKLTGLDVMMLYNNYRLPRTVAKITQNYVGIDVRPYSDRVYQSRESSLPHIVGFDSDEAQFDAIVSLLKSHDLGSIGVLIPDNNGVADLYEKILEARISSECKYSLGKNRFYDSLDFSTSKPKIMTYHSAKGLQFDTVILPFCKSVSGVEEQKALYVAMTRTKKNLFMLYTGSSRPKPLDKVPELLFQNRC